MVVDVLPMFIYFFVLLQAIPSILAPILMKKGAPVDICISLISVILLYAIRAEVAFKVLLIKEGKPIIHSYDLKSIFDSFDK